MNTSVLAYASLEKPALLRVCDRRLKSKGLSRFRTNVSLTLTLSTATIYECSDSTPHKTMRPCNQCRKPVKNAVQLCEDCEKYNAKHKIEAKTTVSLTPVDTNNLPPVPYDSTVNVMLLSTGLCFGLMGLLIGILCGSMTYAIVGMGMGWLIAFIMIPIFR